MKLSSFLWTVVGISIFVSVVCVLFYPSFQDFMESNTFWNGVRRFSNEFRAINIYSLDEVTQAPEKSVLISIPSTDYDNEDLSLINKFVIDGGTLLLMDDYGFGNKILISLGVNARFTNHILLDPLFCYKNQFMPRITDFNDNIKKIGINLIGLNHATTLTGVSESEILAHSSLESYVDLNANGIKDEEEKKGPFPVAAEIQIGKGALKLVSDPSVIINTMFAKDDNLEFTKYLLRSRGENGKLFLDNSHLIAAPIDTAKEKLMYIRQTLSNPYILLVITALAFFAIFRHVIVRKASTH